MLSSRRCSWGGSSTFLAERGPVFVQSLTNGHCRCGVRSFLEYRSGDIRNVDTMVCFCWFVGWMVPGLLGLLPAVALLGSVCVGL